MELNPAKTALILIDLQEGILALDLAPHSAQQVLSRSIELALRFRAVGATVFPVRAAFAADGKDRAPGEVDQPMPRPAGGLPPNWSTLAQGLVADGDIVITKHQWGAFTGTELDLQLRRRGIDTLVIGGIATSFGVESTVRHGWELGYHVVVAEDLCSCPSAQLHETAIRFIFPRISRVVRSSDLQF